MEVLPGVEQSAAEDIFIQKGNSLAQTWNICIASQNESQAAVSFDKLEKSLFHTSDIINLSLGTKLNLLTLGETVPAEINGVEAIMLYNTLKNADQFTLSEVRIHYENGEFRVQNDARTYPNTSTLFQPGQPGVGGNTGFGLFTMKHIIGAMGGYEFDLNHERDGQSAPPYQVEFVIRAPRQVPSLSQTQ